MINNTLDALILMEKYILMSVDYSKNIYLFTLKGDYVIIVNNSINTKITKEDFKTLFSNSLFEIYKPIENTDIDQEHIVYRK